MFYSSFGIAPTLENSKQFVKRQIGKILFIMFTEWTSCITNSVLSQNKKKIIVLFSAV